MAGCWGGGVGHTLQSVTVMQPGSDLKVGFEVRPCHRMPAFITSTVLLAQRAELGQGLPGTGKLLSFGLSADQYALPPLPTPPHPAPSVSRSLGTKVGGRNLLSPNFLNPEWCLS